MVLLMLTTWSSSSASLEATTFSRCRLEVILLLSFLSPVLNYTTYLPLRNTHCQLHDPGATVLKVGIDLCALKCFYRFIFRIHGMIINGDAEPECALQLLFLTFPEKRDEARDGLMSRL